MIHLLFFLSYYEEQIEVASLNHFTKFPYLEFGFKKNAQYFLNFSKTAPEMVFGYATKDELEEIEYYKNDQSYCKGDKELSKVQNYILGGPISVQGTIPSKDKFTPFIFSCDKSYTFKIGLNYQNTKRHLDYRCQDAQIYTIFFFFVFLITTISVSIYFKYLKQLTPTLNLYLLLIIFIVFTIQNFASFCSLTIKNDWEYLYRDTKNSYKNEFTQSMTFVVSRSCIIVVFLDFIYINFLRCKKENEFDSYHRIICTLISSVGAIGAVVTSIFSDKFSIVIPFFASFYCFFIGGFLSFQTPVTFFKIAVAAYQIVMIFEFYYITVYSCHPNSITKHVPLFHSIVASIVAQTVFSVLLLTGVFWKGEFCYDDGSNQILVRKQTTYTTVAESLSDIKDKSNH